MFSSAYVVARWKNAIYPDAWMTAKSMMHVTPKSRHARRIDLRFHFHKILAQCDQQSRATVWWQQIPHQIAKVWRHVPSHVLAIFIAATSACSVSEANVSPVRCSECGWKGKGHIEHYEIIRGIHSPVSFIADPDQCQPGTSVCTRTLSQPSSGSSGRVPQSVRGRSRSLCLRHLDSIWAGQPWPGL